MSISYWDLERAADLADCYSQQVADLPYCYQVTPDEFAWNVNGVAAEHRGVVVDLLAERDCDYYYLRTTMVDGRRAWSSPVWMERSQSDRIS